MTKIIYYTTEAGENPVMEFLDSLQRRDKAKIFRILQNIELYGLLSILPHVKKLSGTPFWEVRVLGRSNIRVIYVSLTEESILVLHGFLKKTQKTPNKELERALTRLNEYRMRP